jgi:hypothetical protein
MNTTNPNLVVIAAILILVVAAAVWWVYTQKRKQSARLQQRFGPEYGSTVERLGNRTKAEADLLAREKRVQGLNIVPLAATDAAKFLQSCNTLQGRFVDNPKEVVAQADQLVNEVMLKRGYPMGDFERRAADISVDHPAVVSNYRAARAITSPLRDQGGEATTEELRKAVVHYRALFDELLEVGEPRQDVPSTAQPQQRQQISVQS